MATYAIGDLQGCLDPLHELLDYVAFDARRDQLWLVGDLVNRGPQSLEVLRFVRNLGSAAITVLGNHDLHLLMQAAGYGKRNAEDTLDAVLAAHDAGDLLAWLRRQPLFHQARIKGRCYALVHAGLLPNWSIAAAQVYSDEVVAALNAPNHLEFLAHMWGSEPAAWRDDLAGWDRLRVIVNAMTRMRYVTRQGAMEFRAPGAKAPPAQGPAGCVPWFDAPDRASAEARVVCGHWSGLGFVNRPDLLALDTGCLWGGSLTAVRLDDERVYRRPCRQYARPAGWE